MIYRGERLREQLEESHRAGGPTPALVDTVQQMARMVVSRRPWIDHQDVSQQALLHLVRQLPGTDVAAIANAGGYVWTIVGRVAAQMVEQEERAQRAVQAATERHRQRGG